MADGDDDIDSLLAAMGGRAAPVPGPTLPTSAAATHQGGLETSALHEATELWNPTVRWNPGVDEVAASAGSAPSPFMELARQKAVKTLAGRFKTQCDFLRTGWKEAEANQRFEKWLLDCKATDGERSTDPLVPLPTTAGEDAGLRRELIESAATRGVPLFMAEMSKSVAKAHRSIQLAATNIGRKSVRIGPVDPPKMGWDGQPMLQLRYGALKIEINQCHYDKLVMMRRMERGDQRGGTREDLGVINGRVFCLLVRYNALQGGGVHGGGMQAAIPAGVFDALFQHYDVCFECFASPLNPRYPRFCSAFPDTDGAFGSVGSFFTFRPRQGSFEANPPFVPGLINNMAIHMHRLIERANDGGHALCFIIIIPSWEHTPGWKALRASPMLTHHERIGQKDHGYTEGAQHCRKTRYRISVGDTSVFFLQSKAATKKWPVTPESLRDIRQAFVSKHAAPGEVTDDPSIATKRKGGDAAEDGLRPFKRPRSVDLPAAIPSEGSSNSSSDKEKKKKKKKKKKSSSMSQ